MSSLLVLPVSDSFATLLLFFAGIDYLRQYLALPAEIVPATHKKQASRPDMRDREEDKFGGGGRPAFRGGDREYRGREGGGGFGRGGGI